MHTSKTNSCESLKALVGWKSKIKDISSNYIQISIAREWTDAIKHLFDWDNNNKHCRYMSPYVYRGLDNLSYELISSLQRCFDDNILRSKPKELILLNNFRKFAPEHESIQYSSEWDWLALGRHHGLPTRLIDWSGSPLIALYNAIEKYFETLKASRPNVNGKCREVANCQHAVVWCLNIDLLHEVGIPLSLQQKMAMHAGRGFTSSALEDSGVESLAKLDSLASEYWVEMELTPLTFILDPPMIDQRIVNQHACFTIQSKEQDGGYPVLSDTLIDYAKRLVKRGNEEKLKHPLIKLIVIHGQAIPKIADYLEQANICPRVLYPGLEGVAKTLENRYLAPPREK